MEVNKAIQPVLATPSNAEQLESEQEECIRHFIANKDAVVLLPTRLFAANSFQIASLSYVIVKR